MVAEPSVQVLTTALAQISPGTDSIGVALTTLKHDIEGEVALYGVNFNTKVIEGINVQIASNFDQVKQVIGVSVGMAKNIDKLIQAAKMAETEKLSYAQITAGVSEQLATMFSNMPSQDKPTVTRFKGIDGKESALAANTISVLGKKKHDYVEWNSKIINAMGWLNRSLGREMKAALRTANRECSQPAFKERAREGITIEKIRDHFEGVAKKLISLSPNAMFQDTSVEDKVKLDSFMERFDEMEPVLDYWFHLKTIGDNAKKVRKATNAWVVYYQLHKWYTETTGQMVQEQAKSVTNPAPIKDDRDIYLSIEKWESDITQLAQYGDSYNFTESAELKLTALEMMFKDKMSLWESVERGIESTKPAAAKLAHMLENLKAIGVRRKAKSHQARAHVNPLDVNYLYDREADDGYEAGGREGYDEYGYEDYGEGYYEEARLYQLGKGKSKGKGKGPKGGCFTCGGSH